MSHTDSIATESDSLCQFFNKDHSTTVRAMARSITKRDVASAEVVQVHQDGFKIDGTNVQGKPFEVSVSFSSPVHSATMVKDTFLQMGERAERNYSSINHRRRREIPGQPPGWRTYWPNWTTFLILLAMGVLSFFYIYFFPETSIPILRWTKDLVGLDFIRFCVHFTIGLHSFETMTAWYLMKRVAKIEFNAKQFVIWSLCVQFLGIGSMLKLQPIVYNSKFVYDEIEREEGHSTTR
ncbi:hypothetical protein BGZ65_005773 [Modicella reniformis]|uniref:DUF2470 domain-containing protein n=1 Tax=Modicella reniformis TaxID=1440133 RepID=A0A9P6MBC3_9FUNG|nr:hypothetical protein BGZ65_005773 [Modicella reniformis]